MRVTVIEQLAFHAAPADPSSWWITQEPILVVRS